MPFANERVARERRDDLWIHKCKSQQQRKKLNDDTNTNSDLQLFAGFKGNIKVCNYTLMYTV